MKKNLRIFTVNAGEISFINNTIFSEQGLILKSTDSTVIMTEVLIKNIDINDDLFIIVQGANIFNNIELQNVTGNLNSSIIIALTSVIKMDKVKLTQWSVNFFRSYFGSATEISNLELVGALNIGIVLFIRSWEFVVLENITFSSISPRFYPFVIINSFVKEMRHIHIQSIEATPVYIRESTIDLIQNITIINCNSGILFQKSLVKEMKESYFEGLGNQHWIQGGALHIDRSNITITNSTFRRNKAKSGAAISVNCRIDSQWMNSIYANKFESNSATKQGGAIFYNMNRPEIYTNIFINNSAPYGQDIGSYVVSIESIKSESFKLELQSVGSGVKYHEEIGVRLVDFDGQTTVLDNSDIVKIVPLNENTSISGIDNAKLNNGVAVFDNLIFEAEPGSQNIKYKVYSDSLDHSKLGVVFKGTILK